MRTLLAGLIVLAGCNEYSLVDDQDNGAPPMAGSIRGRVCSPNGRTWLADAQAYTNIYNDAGIIVDVRQAYSDRDGYWTLDELAPDREYTIYVQYGQEVLQEEVVYINSGEDIVLDEPDCFDPTSLDIALISGSYDDINVLLEDMGFTNFTVIDGLNEDELTGFLTDPDQLVKYDLIFFNGGSIEEGIFWDTNPSNPTPDLVYQNLRDYVYAGGAVFASDWSYDVVEGAWPDAIDFMGDDDTPDAAQLGEYDIVNAMITDESLASYVGATTTEVDYDLPVWPPINSVEPYVSIHMSGTVHYREGGSTYTLASVPLLVTFSGGNGRVGFSTFRVAANQTEDMVLTLQYILHKLR